MNATSTIVTQHEDPNPNPLMNVEWRLENLGNDVVVQARRKDTRGEWWHILHISPTDGVILNSWIPDDLGLKTRNINPHTPGVLVVANVTR